MPFSEGQLIVHPSHGLVRVRQTSQRLVRGIPTKYYDLTAVGQPLEISVPAARALELGLREVIPHARVFELLDILRGPAVSGAMPWSRRLKDYQLRLSTGEIEERCIVIREITRSGAKPPASAEGMMLRTVRSSLGREFAVVLDLTLEEAESVIDSAARGELVDLRRIPVAAVA